MLVSQNISRILVIFACATPAAYAAPMGGKCPTTMVDGAEAQQLDSALRSSGVVVVTLPDQQGTLAFAHSITCGPLNQDATCEVSYRGGSQTVEKAFGLSKLLVQSGASPVDADGHAAYTARNIHCLTQVTSPDGAKEVSCWFEPGALLNKGELL